ncbi:hypothetical protein APUTEX25_001248, partial [Auxenochlorella protothecoides]
EPTGPLNDTTHASKPLAVLRAFFFYVVTFAVATPILLILLLQLPFVLLFDKHRRRAQHVWNTVWARLSAWPFYRVEMTGLEHLPPSDCAAVYVANHQSFLDITTLFHIRRDFKFISKTSNFLIPIIGWTMYLTGHVKIDRMDSRSQMQCLKECGDLLSSGASVLFFPEGTRSKDGKLHAFKKGAFSVAAKRKVPVVPITLQGTGELMPVGAEGRLFSGTIKVRVHPAVPPSQAVAMMAAAQAAVASGLPRDKLGPDVLRAVQSLKGALAAFRAFLFYLNTFAWAGPLFVIMVFLTPYVLAFDRTRRKAQHFFNTLWAKISSFPFYRVVISGLENLPPQEQPAVYVANHQSFLDITTLFHINRDFKFVSKTANFFIPIIGWSMFLTGHIQLDRMDRRSQQKCLKDCGMMLERGTSVAFFPEGTRSKDGKLHAFKRGAFVVASRHNVPVVPITLDGTGDLMPNSREYLLFPGTVHVRIHPAIPPGPVDALTRAAECAIASGLPPERLAPEILGT